jgi:hypothetical protein
VKYLHDEEQRYFEFLDGVIQNGLTNAADGVQNDVTVGIDEARHLRYLARAIREGHLQRFRKGEYVVKLYESSTSAGSAV